MPALFVVIDQRSCDSRTSGTKKPQNPANLRKSRRAARQEQRLKRRGRTEDARWAGLGISAALDGTRRERSRTRAWASNELRRAGVAR